MALSVALGVSPLGLLMPYTRGPEDLVEVTGLGEMTASEAWSFVLADGDQSLSDLPGSMFTRSFPRWVEDRIARDGVD